MNSEISIIPTTNPEGSVIELTFENEILTERQQADLEREEALKSKSSFHQRNKVEYFLLKSSVS